MGIPLPFLDFLFYYGIFHPKRQFPPRGNYFHLFEIHFTKQKPNLSIELKLDNTNSPIYIHFTLKMVRRCGAWGLYSFPTAQTGICYSPNMSELSKAVPPGSALNPAFPPGLTGHGQSVSCQLLQSHVFSPILMCTPDLSFKDTFPISMTKKPLLLNKSLQKE